MKRLCIGVSFLAVVACGGGGDGGSTTGNDPPGPQTIVLASGDSKTVHANVGDKLTVVTAADNRPVSGFHAVPAPGKVCHLSETTVDNGFELTIGENTTGCLFSFRWPDNGLGQVEIIVP